ADRQALGAEAVAVAYREGKIAGSRLGGDGACPVGGQRQWLLHQQVLTGPEHLDTELLVRHVRRADDHGLDLVVGEELLERAIPGASLQVRDLGRTGRGRIEPCEELAARAR